MNSAEHLELVNLEYVELLKSVLETIEEDEDVEEDVKVHHNFETNPLQAEINELCIDLALLNIPQNSEVSTPIPPHLGLSTSTSALGEHCPPINLTDKVTATQSLSVNSTPPVDKYPSALMNKLGVVEAAILRRLLNAPSSNYKSESSSIFVTNIT